MQKLKKNKGITLIALIITIIVMLILVGVTINIAINGGLFDTARNAKLATLKAQEQEELSMTAISVYNANTRSIDATELENAINALDNEYVKDSTKTTSSKYVVTGPSGTIWQIDLATAEVTEYKEQANPWTGRGLSSTEVTYDTAYTGSAKIDGDFTFTSINFIANGDIESNIQNAESSEIDNALSAGYVYIDSGNNLFVWQIASNEYAGFLIDSNEAKVYVHTSASNILTSGTYCGSLYVTPPTPSYPLSGKTFKLAYMNSEAYNLVFSDTSFTFAGVTGDYEYNSGTNRITGSITMPGASEATNIDTILYTSGNNSYFELEFSGTQLPMSLNGSMDDLMPFSGEYINGSDSCSFVTDTNGYCEISLNNNAHVPCCYFEQNNRLYYARIKSSLLARNP